MGGIRSMEEGIQAIQQGNLVEGARLLRIALRDRSLPASLRAATYIWLAETSPEREHKIQCYNDALAADPNNENAQRRLSALLTASLPPLPEQPYPGTTPPPTPPPSVQAYEPPPNPGDSRSMRVPAVFYRTVGIIDGPNGLGTAFFITADGLLVTTRRVISGMENVTIELEPGRHVMGRVMRSFPAYDLALIEVEMSVGQLLPFSMGTTVPENTDLTAISYNGKRYQARCRDTRRQLEPYWIPTTFREVQDAGGNPVFDESNYVVGMLTRNASRTSTDLFVLHIGMIRSCMEHYIRELRTDPNGSYCPSCGSHSRVANAGGYYCEYCGSILPYARSIPRAPRPYMESLYGENMQAPCRTCGSRVGRYDGRCLRCGDEN